MRFVLLQHSPPDSDSDSPLRTTNPHFDLMLEIDQQDKLATLAFEQMPDNQVGVPVEWLSPHRREYLDFEGPISGNRGAVRRVAFGEYTADAGVAALEAGQGALWLSFDGQSGNYASQRWCLEIRQGKLIRRDTAN